MQPAASSGAANGAVSSPGPEEIRAHVARVLASPAFRASKRCYRFLEFIITQTLEGNSAMIKERTLATEVFDRSASWDSGGDDTIVRVGAREVRKRLAQFYGSPEGMQEKIRIELPLGSYVPEVVRLNYPLPLISANAAAEAAPAKVPAEAESAPAAIALIAKPISRSWMIAAGAAVLATSLLIFAILNRPTEFAQFWEPYIHSSEPVLIAVAAPLVYSPSARAYQLNDKRWGTPSVPVVRPLQLDPNQLNGSDFIPRADEYLAIGDSIATTDVQLLLAQHSRVGHVRFASRVEFGEFRDSPVILIGAFTNRWTVELTQHMRYHFGYDVNWVPAILNQTNPGAAWSIRKDQENGASREDYFLVCRMPNSPAGTPMLIAGGVQHFGTEAAGRFISDPERLGSLLKGIHQDWKNKNLEFVMHAKVIGNSPAAPELVAAHVW